MLAAVSAGPWQTQQCWAASAVPAAAAGSEMVMSTNYHAVSFSCREIACHESHCAALQTWRSNIMRSVSLARIGLSRMRLRPCNVAAVASGSLQKHAIAYRGCLLQCNVGLLILGVDSRRVDGGRRTRLPLATLCFPGSTVVRGHTCAQQHKTIV